MTEQAAARSRVTVAYGDGIGPEIMTATLRVLEAAHAPVDYDEVVLGEQAYRQGHMTGISPEAWAVIRRNRVLLKAPMTTPQGGGYKSLNVTLRKALHLFANVRPARAYAPAVASAHPDMDLVIIRENEEDLYAGIEHQQTADVTQVLKLITRSGSERIIRYAFAYARAHGRRRVTCMTKDNIMKITDGLFHRTFDAVAREYPEIDAEHAIIDIGAARLATRPERFDVIVTLNLYGDILSDIAAEVAGSVGLGGSANIGAEAAMFEAVHGSAPDLAGQGVANPSGLLMAAVQMLVHLGHAEAAARIANAWLATLEEGIHTADIYRPTTSRRKVGTLDFASAVIERLGAGPSQLAPVRFRPGGIHVNVDVPPTGDKQLVGVDVFLDWRESGRDPEALARQLEAAAPAMWALSMITNRGVKVYPGGLPETFCTDHWRSRWVPATGGIVDFSQVLVLLAALHRAGLDVIKTEHLYTFDGVPAYSRGQGE